MKTTVLVSPSFRLSSKALEELHKSFNDLGSSPLNKRKDLWSFQFEEKFYIAIPIDGLKQYLLHSKENGIEAIYYSQPVK